MKTYIFHGRVIPERAQVNFEGPEIELTQPDSSLSFKFKVNIVLSEISVWVQTQIDPTDLLSLKNFLTDAVSFFVDCIGYDNGCAYTIELDSCTYNDGNDFIAFDVNIDELHEKLTWESGLDVIDAYGKGTDIQKAQLQRSVSELKRAIKTTYDTAFHVFRAIESLKRTFPGKTDLQMWQDMCEALNMSESYIAELRDKHALDQRHGGYTFMSSDERIEMLVKAKTVISRFVSYVRGGNEGQVTL